MNSFQKYIIRQEYPGSRKKGDFVVLDVSFYEKYAPLFTPYGPVMMPEGIEAFQLDDGEREWFSNQQLNYQQWVKLRLHPNSGKPLKIASIKVDGQSYTIKQIVSNSYSANIIVGFYYEEFSYNKGTWKVFYDSEGKSWDYVYSLKKPEKDISDYAKEFEKDISDYAKKFEQLAGELMKKIKIIQNENV